MASDVSSGCTEVNELFDDEKEEGEISLEDVSSSEEGQLYKYPPRASRGQCPHCLSTQHCATWCRSLTVNKINNVKRDGGVQGKENRGNRHYDKESAGVSNMHSKHAGLYSTLQEKNDEAQIDLVPISSDSDMELVGLESTKKEKKHRKLHKKRRKKSPVPTDVSLELSIKDSIHRLESGMLKKEAGLKSSHSRTRYSPDKKSMLLLPPKQRRHSRLSPVKIRPRRPRSPLLRKPSPQLRQRKLHPETSPIVMNPEVDLTLEPSPSRGSVNKLLKKVRNLEHFSSRSKEKGSSLKDKLINIIKNEKKDSSAEETSCKENRPVDTVTIEKDSSKNEIKSKESDKKKEKDKSKETECMKEKEIEKDKSKEHKEKATEREKVKEKGRQKDKIKERQKEKDREKDKAKEKVKEKVREKMKEKEKKRMKVKENEINKEKEKIQIKVEKGEEKKSLEENMEEDDDLIVLRQIALKTKQNKTTLIKPEQIKIEPIDPDEDEEKQDNKFPKMPNFCMDDNDEDLQLRMIALRSAVIKKHRTRMQFGLKKKQTKSTQQKDQQDSAVPRMESPFTASFIDDFPLLAEICSPSSPLSKKDSLSVEDMVLDSDMELTAISEDESPYSPSDDIVCDIVDSSLYTPSKPTETPCPKRPKQKPATQDFNGSFLDFTNQESRPYSPTDITIYDPDLPGVHTSTDPPPILALTSSQMQHPQPLHPTPPLRPPATLQPPPLPPMNMFSGPVPVREPMVLGCPPNVLNPFVDPTLANFSMNPMMLAPPQLYTPYPSMPQPAPPSLPPASQLDNFGETDLDGSPLVQIEKDGQQQQQQWRLLNEPLYLQDLPPLGEPQISKVPLLPTPNLVPTAVLKSNKQLQKQQPSRKSSAVDNSLFRNAEMTPVLLEPDVCKPSAMFKPMKLQPCTKKNVPLQPSAAFNCMAEDLDSPRTSQYDGRIAEGPAENAENQKTLVTLTPQCKRKMSRRERKAAKRALKETVREVKTIKPTTSETAKTEEPKKVVDKKRRGSMEDDEEILREILLASLAKRIKEHKPDNAVPSAEPSSTGNSVKIVEDSSKVVVATEDAEKTKAKADVCSADTSQQSSSTTTNNSAKTTSSTSSTTTKASTESTTSLDVIPSTSSTTTKTSTESTTSLDVTPSTSTVNPTPPTNSISATTTKPTNNLKRPSSTLADSQPLNKIARKTASAKVVNNAKRYQNLLQQRKLAQQKNLASAVSRFKVTNNGSRSVSPNLVKLDSNRLIINLNEDSESESEKDEAKLSPTKERPQLSIPETEFEMSLNQFLKSAREQHEMTAATTVTSTTVSLTESTPEVENTKSPATAEVEASPSIAEINANSLTAETIENPSKAATTTTSTDTIPTTFSKTSDTVIITTAAAVPSTSKIVEVIASTSKAATDSVTAVKVSRNTIPAKATTITTSTAKTSIATVTKTVPGKISADQVAAAVKLATVTATKNDSTPKTVKTSAKSLTNPALTPLAVKHLPASQQEEYRRLKLQIYEYERQKRLKAKELEASASTANKPINSIPASTTTVSSVLKSPPSLRKLALASSTPKAASKLPAVATSESLIPTTSTTSTAAVSMQSVTAAISAPSVTIISKPPIAAVSTSPNTAAPIRTITMPSVSVTAAKPIVAAAKPATTVTSSTSKPLPAVIEFVPKSQLVATISPMAKPSLAESLSRTSSIVLITPTKIVHTTASSASHVKTVPSKTASLSSVATSRNIIASNPKVVTSSKRILPQSTQESPTKLLDKMNTALNNQRLQISAVAHKVSSLRILTKEQINHKSSQNQETAPSTSTVNLNVNRISKEPTSNSSVCKGWNENLPPARTSNNLQKTSSTEISAKRPPTSLASANSSNKNNSNSNNAKKNWEDFKHEVNNEVQSLTDLTAEDQRNLLRDTEEKLINKRHLVLDDITEMSSNLRQWEIERDLQNMLSSEVKKLREQLRIAEEKVQRQKEKLSSIQPRVSSYHEKINEGRKECFRLSKICSGLGQQVVGSSYKVPTAGAELLNNRIKEVANHTQKLKSKKSQSSGTLQNNNSQKTDKTTLKNNPRLNNYNNLTSKEPNSRQNNFNGMSASLPNNHNLNTNSNIGTIKSEETETMRTYDTRIIKEEVISDESSDDNASAENLNNDVVVQSEDTNVNNLFLTPENNRTDKTLNSANVSNANLTAVSLNSNINNGELSAVSISNTRSENCFNSENTNSSQNFNVQSTLNVNEIVSTANEKTNSRSENEISSRKNFNEKSAASDNENNVESINLISVTNNVENLSSEIVNQNLLTTADTDNVICNANNLNNGSEQSIESSDHVEKSVNENSFEENPPVDLIVDSACNDEESDKNLERETLKTAVEDNGQRTQQNELCFESNSTNVNKMIENIKKEPEMEMEIDSDGDSVLLTTVPQAENVEFNNNAEDIEEFADSKLNERLKEINEENENYQSEFPTVSAGTAHSSLLEEINLLEIANAVEVPKTFTRYSQKFRQKKRRFKLLKKAENITENSTKKKVPRPYESILKHLNAPSCKKSTQDILLNNSKKYLFVTFLNDIREQQDRWNPLSV